MEIQGKIYPLLCKNGEKVVFNQTIPDFGLADTNKDFVEISLASVIEGENEYPVYLDDAKQEYRVALKFLLMHPHIKVYSSRKLNIEDSVTSMYFQ